MKSLPALASLRKLTQAGHKQGLRLELTEFGNEETSLKQKKLLGSRIQKENISHCLQKNPMIASYLLSSKAQPRSTSFRRSS